MNILIVDDDIMIRNLLSMLIEQIEDFTNVVTSVSSADEAEALCDKSSVDLVITDITMPNRSGLDLIRSLRKKHPEIQIACLSAYDDYDYIREALKLGVLDYILKSEMKLEDIISLLDKVESFSSISKDATPSKDELDSLNNTNTLLELYLHEDDAQTEEVCARMDCDTDDGIVVVAFQLWRHVASVDEMLKAQRIAEKTREGEHKSGLSFAHEGERIVMLLKDTSNSIESRENEMMRLSLLYKRNLAEYSRQNVVFSLYEVALNSQQLRNTFIKTMDIMDAYEYYPNYQKGKFVLKNLSKADTRMLQQLAQGDGGRSDLQAYADEFMLQVEQWHRDYTIPRQVKSVASCGLLYLMGYNELHIPENLLVYNHFAKKIRYSRDEANLEHVLRDALATVISKSLPQKKIMNTQIQEAVQYINANYGRKITLDDIAKHIYLNRTYASYMFKKHMNVNFMDYLEMVRINKAKELLLESNLPITEIAVKVGYASQSYFTKVFKRNTGLSPNIFRSLAKK